MEENLTYETVSKMLKKQKEYYENKLKEKPSTIQIIAFGMSCFALGFSITTLFI